MREAIASSWSRDPLMLCSCYRQHGGHLLGAQPCQSKCILAGTPLVAPLFCDALQQ